MVSVKVKQCAFCAVVRGDVDCYGVFEDDATVAFLDNRPLFAGHCLLVPRDHFETLADLPVNLIAPLFTNAQLLARAVEEALEAEGSFVAINNRVSQSVPHLHVHVVPRRRKDGLRGFFWPRHRYESHKQILMVQESLRSAVARIKGNE